MREIILLSGLIESTKRSSIQKRHFMTGIMNGGMPQRGTPTPVDPKKQRGKARG
ncbi:MAG: hypothetical protein KKG10_17595 [Proteobacteria bacterium]|nr:hypothetical protein [Pseudomonadota bacterium]